MPKVCPFSLDMTECNSMQKVRPFSLDMKCMVDLMEGGFGATQPWGVYMCM